LKTRNKYPVSKHYKKKGGKRKVKRKRKRAKDKREKEILR